MSFGRITQMWAVGLLCVGIAFGAGCRKDNPLYGMTDGGNGSMSASTTTTTSTSTSTSTSTTTSAPTSTSTTASGSTSGGELPDGLVLWYRFQNSETLGVVVDSGPLGLDATCVSCMEYTSGPDGQAALFDGGDTDLTSPASAALEIDEFTIAAWVRLDDVPQVGGTRHILSKALNSGDSSSYELMFSNSGTLSLRCRIRGGSVEANVETSFTTVGAWTHVATTYDDRGNMTLFINGERATTTLGFGISHSMSPVAIAHDASSGTRTSHMAGGLDELRVYSEALSEAEITALAQAP